MLTSNRAHAQTGAAKPSVAVFPLGGDADGKLKDRIATSLRAKINRSGVYTAIDGPLMADTVADATAPINAQTSADAVRQLLTDSDATVLMWGEADAQNPAAGPNGPASLKLEVLDLRDKTPTPHLLQEQINTPLDVRFAVERILSTLPRMTPFVHPNEQPVHHDLASDAAFAHNPNLLADGDFQTPGQWQMLLGASVTDVGLSDALPDNDQAAIYRVPADEGQPAYNALAMNMSQGVATSNGLACLSQPIEIQPGVKYRIQFLYRSDGPTEHVFVKGYTSAKDIAGKPADREIYRCQVPPSGSTDGQWRKVECDMNPQQVYFPVQRLRVDLYVYLHGGTIFFRDVQLKAVGQQGAQDQAHDDAIKPPTTQMLRDGDQ